jgi:hypothetical protein
LSKKIKLIRHQHSGWDLYQMMVEGHLDTYQKFQARPVFNCDVIVSFLGTGGTTSRLLGVYEVGESKLAKNVPTPDYPHHEKHSHLTDIFYELERLPGFEDLEQRVIIDWGKATRSWHQWLTPKDKKVIQILPEGFARPWPGFLDFVLPFAELERIVKNPDANSEWHMRMSSVGGIYLITLGQDLYVGSASGGHGLMGRWSQYATSGGHCGNKLLEKAVERESSAKLALNFSVLRTFPLSTPRKEAVEIENLWKVKLGSRAYGLNDN